MQLLKSKERSHSISIDFAPVFETSAEYSEKTIASNSWPRRGTSNCLTHEKIRKIKKQRLCLVPKEGRFWYVSFSRLEKALMRCIDSAFTCRRKCYKILKAQFILWNKEEKMQQESADDEIQYKNI